MYSENAKQAALAYLKLSEQVNARFAEISDEERFWSHGSAQFEVSKDWDAALEKTMEAVSKKFDVPVEAIQVCLREFDQDAVNNNDMSNFIF